MEKDSLSEFLPFALCQVSFLIQLNADSTSLEYDEEELPWNRYVTKNSTAQTV